VKNQETGSDVPGNNREVECAETGKGPKSGKNHSLMSVLEFDKAFGISKKKKKANEQSNCIALHSREGVRPTAWRSSRRSAGVRTELTN